MEKSQSDQKINEKNITEEIDDYEYTLQTLSALCNIFDYNFKAKNSQGKKLKTSNSNTIQKNTEVTPDLAVEFTDASKPKKYGILAEIKTELPMEKNYWEKYVIQLKKYDDDLTQWTKPISKHDIALVTNPNRTFDFDEYLKSPQIRGKYNFKRNLTIVSSHPVRQVNEFMFVKKEYGEFSHNEVEDKLKRGISVAHVHLLDKLKQMKFYDAKPPLIYTMMIMWDHIFKTYLDLWRVRELGRRRTVELIVNLKDIIEKLGVFAPVTNPNCIEREWIVEAMEAYTEIGIATVLASDIGSYEIKFSQPKQDLRIWLIEKFKDLEKKKSSTLDKFFPEQKNKIDETTKNIS